MLLTINYISVIICSFVSCLAVKRILRNKYSILHLCVIVFFIMQVLPLIVDSFNDIGELYTNTNYLYYSMTDDTVSFIYSVFCVTTVLILYELGNRYAIKAARAISISVLKKKNKIVKVLTFIFMFLPFMGVLLSPIPEIYANFSYFYTPFVMTRFLYIFKISHQKQYVKGTLQIVQKKTGPKAGCLFYL